MPLAEAANVIETLGSPTPFKPQTCNPQGRAAHLHRHTQTKAER
jgi:hypothetical protein